MPTRALRFVLVMLVVLGSGVGLAAAEQETPRAITPGLHKKRAPATRANLNELDSGTEKAGSEDNTTPPDRGGVSEQTRREVERQRIQREARKKRQRENREKRQKRTDEINRKARNKELYRLFTANLWVLLLCVVLLCGCVIAINDISILFVSVFGRFLGIDVEAFIKARRKLSRASSAGVWAGAVGSTSSSLASTLSRALRGKTSASASASASSSLSSSSSSSSLLSSSSSQGHGYGHSQHSPQAELNSVSWFGRHKNQFKNSEDPGDVEAGSRGVFFSARS